MNMKAVDYENKDWNPKDEWLKSHLTQNPRAILWPPLPEASYCLPPKLALFYLYPWLKFGKRMLENRCLPWFLI